MTALSLIAPVYAASPDLSVSGTDITFSNNTPEPSENISISAVIKNNGGLYSYEIPFGKHDYMVGVSSDYTSVCSTISWGQYFIPAENMYLGKVSLLINNIGETSDAMGVEIRRTEASSFIRPSLQSYDKLAYTAVVSTFTSFGWQDFEFDTAAYLVSGTTYWICAYNLSDKANGYQLWLDSGTTLDCLAGSTDLGSTWSSIAAIPGKWNVFFKAFKSTSTFVGFYAGNPDSGGLLIGSTVYQTPIPAGSSRSETFQWAAVNGSTDIYVTVDYPGGIINETLENNNVAYKNITVAPTYPAITGSVSPPENAADVGVNDIISAVFSEYMSSSTVVPAITVKAVRDSAGVAISEAAGGTVEYSTSSKTLTFSALWKKGYKYQVTISTGAQDLYGNAMAAAKVWEFTTMNLPAIVTVSPSENSSGVSPAEPVKAVFWNDDMSSATVVAAITVIAVRDSAGVAISEAAGGTVEYSTSSKTLTFSALWKKGYKYQVTISTGAQDLYGNAMAAAKVWEFTTMNLPAIVTVSPSENSSGVSPAEPVKAVFWNDDMSSATVVAAITVIAVRDSAGVAISEAAGGTVEYSTSSKTLTFSALWKKGYKYQVTISTGAQDLYGNAMAAAKIWEFTITDMPALSGTVSPAEDAIGIAVSEPARVTFLSDDMDPAAAKSAISVRAVKDNLGADINEPVSGTVEYSDKTLSFSALWKKGYKYRVTVSTDAKDLYGNAIISGKIWQFTTVVDCLAENIFTAGDSATKVTIVPGAVDFDYYIIIDTSPAIGTLLTDADGKAIGLRGPYAGAVNSGVRKFLMYKGTYAGTLAGDKFQKSVSIVIPYAENGDGFVTTSNGRLVKENTLSIYGLDETKKLWVRNPNSEVDTVKNTVTARVNHFSIYAVSGNSDTDLSSAYAYPVPWKPFDGKDETGTESGGITFTGLSSQATIRVYTVSGELVRALDYNFSGGKEELVWDGKNSSGESVASGLYVYYIENAREHKSGKIIIIK
ncbi:MAG: hypothetical protein A2251_00305 [Elusimicrobia bacterium RIFOXYA2_FULL_47_53]|nr:MAG: hypothetical protein A2251_00305 [Elusimicrobia bacterium RIFOXYA2_FULL_47_53]